MKTAVSRPDELYHRADRLARKLKKSRSQLYAEAIADYLARLEPDEVTDALNRVADQVATRPDAFASTAATAVLRATDW